MKAYQLNSEETVLRRADGAFVPIDAPENADSIAYRAWLDAGNNPDPADPLPQPGPSQADQVTALVGDGLAALEGARTLTEVKAAFGDVLRGLDRIHGAAGGQP